MPRTLVAPHPVWRWLSTEVIQEQCPIKLYLAFGSQPTDGAGTPPLRGDIVGRPEMGQDREPGKSERTRLRELASIAYERELITMDEAGSALVEHLAGYLASMQTR